MASAPGELSSADSQLVAPPAVVAQQFAVRFEYPVVFTRRVFAPDNHALAWSIAHREPQRRHRLWVAIDDGVARAWPQLVADIEAYARVHGEHLELVDAPTIVPGGEAIKNDPRAIPDLLAKFEAARLDRHAFVVAIGGGAMLDAVGFATAIAHRGLRLVRVPTTVLAQNDAGIGVKNGVNAFGSKNFAGTFAPPHAVVDDFDFVRTLPDRDRRAGMAEAVKVALIRDPMFVTWLEHSAAALRDAEPAAMETMIRRCAELHLHHIRSSGDPFETGSARPLDFGHWAAHKLELLTEHRLRHGEAVAIGLGLDSAYSARIGRLSWAAAERVRDLLLALQLPIYDDAFELRDDSGRRRVLAGLAEFREHLGGELTVTLLDDIGRGIEVHAMDEDHIEAAIEWLRSGTA